MPTPHLEALEADAVGWRFDNTYARLPEAFHAPASAAAFRAPRVVLVNHPLAAQMGLDLHALPPEVAAAVFTGQALPPGGHPIAQAYAGHQYGGFTMLGDGRAILLGEHRTPDGRLLDIQLKGPGRTRFSRGGDGLAALGPMLREYVLSEAMAALGIPTTRSLAVAVTGEMVRRERMLRGAVLTRVAASHLRVGTFEYAAAFHGPEAVRVLADYAIERHDPELADAPRKYLGFLRAVAGRQAELIARWQLVGFIHGVMNTDNMAISGETIDFGPCAFMNAYDPATVYSSIDRGGRYSYGNQPRIALWNLARLAESLLPLIDDDPEKGVAAAMEVLNAFPADYQRHWLAGMRRKLGLATEEDGDEALAQSLLDWMRAAGADFTNTFRALSSDEALSHEPYREEGFQAWLARWRERLGREGADLEPARAVMRGANPVVIPRNRKVEEALAAAEADDLGPLHRLLEALAHPYGQRPGLEPYQASDPDPPGYRTFCGT
jgi:uncharacterized protein YdiU (UPF0061 family)